MTPEAIEFRAALAQLGHSQSSFARQMRDLGDPRSVPTILRSVANYARGATAVPGEIWVILRLLRQQDLGHAAD